MAESPRFYGTNINLPTDLAFGDLALTSVTAKTITFKKAGLGAIATGIASPPTCVDSGANFDMDMVSFAYDGRVYQAPSGVLGHIVDVDGAGGANQLEVTVNSTTIFDAGATPTDLGVDGSSDLDALLVDGSLVTAGLYFTAICAAGNTATVRAAYEALGYVIPVQLNSVFLMPTAPGNNYTWNLPGDYVVAGEGSYALKAYITFTDTAPGALVRIIRIRINGTAGATDYPVSAGNHMLTVESPMETLSFYLETAGDSVMANVWAFGDVDMSGSSAA